ncbi:long-chain fatty acid transport protein 4-like [Cylas formicarius]|uniref:long-chain fatty acid transport protein 4-like n=1 Tax=Cylas formicarius TaxID=197179 RepID=UPI0029589317|nr:long-chain fatty acid transport protein 4-like [Cylas formicarius]
MILFVTLIVLFATFLIGNRRYRWIYVLFKTLPRDLLAGFRFAQLNFTIWKWERNQETIPKLFTKLVDKHPDKVAFYIEDRQWTFRQVEEFSNRVSHYFKSLGYKKGDTVALLMENRPEYVGIWLGLSKIGVVTALINTNLSSDPLEHCIGVAKSKAVIFGSDFSKVISDLTDQTRRLELFEFKTGEKISSTPASVRCLKTELESQKTISPIVDIIATQPRDKVVYIYTSGTTGLPKAAVISNTRFMFIVIGVHAMVGIKGDDVYYNPLPLYHSAGGMVAAGQTVIFGVTNVLRKKFSATNYWSDCRKYKCTISNYIGEICRYLLTVHGDGNAVEHDVKKMIGNGLRPQIWNKFRDTFKIQNIYEFYGSTEGNSNLINIDNKIGAVGFVPRYAYGLYPIILIKCDENTGEPIRNNEGFCTQCEVDEPGILLGKINPRKVHSEFTGYADEKATKKKILKDVFQTGDLYFNSGDVLVQDELGYYYFRDRTGDTYRWKGENVSTSEVEAVISSIVDLKDSAVYGVQIPGTEGRAGMAAIVDPQNTLDLDQLSKGVKSKLPAYAIPMFLRVLDSAPLTGTFKLKKVDLQREGYDVSLVKDHRLYFYNAKLASYSPLTGDVYADIISGKMKL